MHLNWGFYLCQPSIVNAGGQSGCCSWMIIASVPFPKPSGPALVWLFLFSKLFYKVDILSTSFLLTTQQKSFSDYPGFLTTGHCTTAFIHWKCSSIADSIDSKEDLPSMWNSVPESTFLLNVHVFTNLEALQILFFWNFVDASLT